MPTPTPDPSATDDQEELERPAIPIIGDAIPRVRGALENITATPRQRITLILILIGVGLLAIIIFAYLILRRR